MAETADPILEDFKNHLSFERQLSQNTLTAYVADAAHYLEYCTANELSPDTVPPQFLDQYAYQLRVVENLSAASVFRKLEAVKSFYKFLLIEGRITEDPTRFLKSPKLPLRMPEQLSRQDMERLLSYPAEKFDEVRTLTMVELLYAAGLRVSELINLQLENVVNIPRMDLTPNKKLQTLVLLKPLETSAVKYLNCSGLSELKSLDYGSAPDTLILDNCSSLEKLTVNGNKVRSVSITGMTGLKELTFQSVDMDTIILPDLPSLTDLSLINNYYTYELYAEGTYNVKRLTLTGNSLGFKACRMNFARTLEELTITQTGYGSVSAYALDTIDFSNHARLTKADISGLGSHRDHSYHIDLSGCTSLPYVSIQTQGVTGIDLSGCSSLSIADLESCRNLTSLDVSGCGSLVGLDLYDSGLSAEALNEVFRQLPTRIPGDAALLRIVNSTGAGSCDLSIANDKEWTPTQMDISIPE